MKYQTLANADTIKKTTEALIEHGFTPIVVSDGKEALQKIKSLIPKGASVMNGASKTLEQIGYIEYLKSGKHEWNNLHEAIVLEKDPEKQALMRREAVISDYYLGSVHALSETGELVIASNTGSQLPHLAYTSPNLVLVVGTQKITASLSAALDRLESEVIPMENENMLQKYGMGTMHSKTLILRRENPMMGRNVQIILVQEHVGF